LGFDQSPQLILAWRLHTRRRALFEQPIAAAAIVTDVACAS